MHDHAATIAAGEGNSGHCYGRRLQAIDFAPPSTLTFSSNAVELSFSDEQLLGRTA